LSFVDLIWNRITYKLAINWQNFARVRLLRFYNTALTVSTTIKYGKQTILGIDWRNIR